MAFENMLKIDNPQLNYINYEHFDFHRELPNINANI